MWLIQETEKLSDGLDLYVLYLGTLMYLSNYL